MAQESRIFVLGVPHALTCLPLARLLHSTGQLLCPDPARPSPPCSFCFFRPWVSPGSRGPAGISVLSPHQGVSTWALATN